MSNSATDLKNRITELLGTANNVETTVAPEVSTPQTHMTSQPESPSEPTAPVQQLKAPTDKVYTDLIAGTLVKHDISHHLYISDSVADEIQTPTQTEPVMEQPEVPTISQPVDAEMHTSEPEPTVETYVLEDPTPEVEVSDESPTDAYVAGNTVMDAWWNEVLSKNGMPISRVWYLFRIPIEIISKIHDEGGAKYPKYMWRENPADIYTNCLDALMRHSMALINGQAYDSESGFLHRDHILCRAHMLLSVYMLMHYTLDEGHAVMNTAWTDDMFTTASVPSYSSNVTIYSIGAMVSYMRLLEGNIPIFKKSDDEDMDYNDMANMGHNIFASVGAIATDGNDVTVSNEYNDTTFMRIRNLFHQALMYIAK